MTGERTRTSHDVVVLAWAMLSLERFRAAHGRNPVMGKAGSGVSTRDSREGRRLMDPEPCWDCGEPREESQLSDYFCRACRDARALETLAEIDRNREIAARAAARAGKYRQQRQGGDA